MKVLTNVEPNPYRDEGTKQVRRRRLGLRQMTHPRRRTALVELLPEDRNQKIAINAYYKAKDRGFVPGFELQDWLEAEREVDAVRA